MGFQSNINQVIAASTGAAIAAKKSMNAPVEQEAKAEEVKPIEQQPVEQKPAEQPKQEKPVMQKSITPPPSISREDANRQALIAVLNQREQQKAIKAHFESLKNRKKEVKANV